MNDKTLVVTGVGSGIVLLVLFWIFLPGEEEPETVVTPVTSVPVPAAIAPAEVVQEPAPPPLPEPRAPEISLQQEPAPPQPEPVILPGLNASDPFVQEQIAGMANAEALRRQLAGNQIIRKFVVLIDGLSRGDIPARDLPVVPPQTAMTVSEQGDEFYILDPASYNRFNMLVNVFTSIDSEQAVARFHLMEPLFETAYAELGYPGRSFRDALGDAIGNILAANLRVPAGAILLTRPTVNYHFADPGLENRSDLEKLFIRMGPENAGRVQGKVREISTLLAE